MNSAHRDFEKKIQKIPPAKWKPHIQREALDCGPQGLVAEEPKQATRTEHRIGSPEFSSTTVCLCIHD